MRVFKNKWFRRWAGGEGFSDADLCAAARDVATGRVEANLGGYLFKKRIARRGGGKRGGYRTVVGFRKAAGRLLFVHGFSKNQKDNLTSVEQAAFSLVAKSFLNAGDAEIGRLIADREILGAGLP